MASAREPEGDEHRDRSGGFFSMVRELQNGVWRSGMKRADGRYNQSGCERWGGFEGRRFYCWGGC